METAEKQIQLVLNEREAEALLGIATFGLAAFQSETVFQLMSKQEEGITGSTLKLLAGTEGTHRANIMAVLMGAETAAILMMAYSLTGLQGLKSVLAQLTIGVSPEHKDRVLEMNIPNPLRP